MPRILVVEDDADVQTVILEFLESTGHQVVAAVSAEQARLILASESIDLALIDCLMGGERGSSLAEHAYELGIPTILTSGNPHFSETTAVPFLPKPFRLTELDELISRTLKPLRE